MPLEKIIAIVTDNRANIVKASIDTFGKSRHARCFAYTLNVVPEKSFQNSPEISAILEKIRNIIR
jgi:transketolase